MERIKPIVQAKGELLLHLLGGTLLVMALAEAWLSTNTLTEKGWTSYAILAFVVLFYTNLGWLIPRYLKARQWLAFGLVQVGLAGLLLGLGLLGCLLAYCQGHDGLDLLLSAIVGGISLSLAYTFTRDWIRHSWLIDKLRAEKLAMELAFLKSQVDPHFLFNSLNSLYALALEEDSPKTADGIVKLGALMRYNLHDSQAEFIPLQKEVDYIRRYVELQSLRMPPHNEVQLQLDLAPQVLDTAQIAPMLLIPLVENAFKHGLRPRMPAAITIQLSLHKGLLLLTVSNQMVSPPPPATTGEPGVGLHNVRSRLHLLYPGRHQLQLEQIGQVFYARLQIKLQEI